MPGAPTWVADVKVRADRENGIYSPGESATWTIETLDLALNLAPSSEESTDGEVELWRITLDKRNQAPPIARH